MVTAALSLAGLFVSLYLWFFKMGWLGTLACGTGGCEAVQLSEYSVVFGVPVALLGVIGYAVLLGASIWGLHGTWAERREPTLLLVLLSGTGVAYAAYLTYLEAAVIHAWCQWCVGSAVIITAICATAIVGLRRIGGPAGR